ncbi:MAG: hypothetical protein HWE39_08575 [Oceanospirillaceae bacterium]|nr:hypothetical protein [Oceanospirillaceae bacterium]
MPHTAPQALVQSLFRAIELEDDHIHRFRTWALRLRPFDLSLARILDLHAEEMRDHKRMLLDCSTTQTRQPRNLPVITTLQAPTTENFFIVNPTGAATILEKARAAILSLP